MTIFNSHIEAYKRPQNIHNSYKETQNYSREAENVYETDMEHPQVGEKQPQKPPATKTQNNKLQDSNQRLLKTATRLQGATNTTKTHS